MALTIIDGFEHGNAAGPGSGGRFDNVTGAPSVLTTTPRTGTYHLEINTTNAAEYVGYTVSTGMRILTGSFYIRFPTAIPTTDVGIVTGLGPTNLPGIRFNGNTDDKFAFFSDAGRTSFGPVISPDTWYLIDFTIDVSTSTFTGTGRVDGANEGTRTATSQTAADITQFRFGTTATTETVQFYIDDFVLTANASGATTPAYPIGSHFVEGLLPTGDGTHNITAVNSFERSATGTDITNAITDVYTLVDAIPASVSTDYVLDVGPGVVYRGVGAQGAGTTSASMAEPASCIEGDLMLIVMESSDSTTAAGTPNTPTDWTKIFERTEGGGATGVTTLTIFARVRGSGSATVTVDGVGDHLVGYMFAVVKGTHGVVTPSTDIAVGAGTGHGTSITDLVTGATTVTQDSLVFWCIGMTDDAGDSTNASGYTASNLNGLTELIDRTEATGAGGGVAVVIGTVETTTTGPNTNWDHDTAVNSQSVMIGIPPAADQYVEVTFANLVATTGTVIDVVAYLVDTDSGATGATGAIGRIVMSDGSSVSPDVRKTTDDPGTGHYFRDPVLNRSWTISEVNGIKGRLGFADGYESSKFGTFMVEVAIGPTSGTQLTHIVLSATPSLPAAQINHALTHLALTVTPTFPAAQINHALTHIVLTATPSLPAARVDHALTHIVLTATPTFPAAQINHALTHIVLTATPTFPAAQINHALTHIVLTATPSLPAAQINRTLTDVALAATPTFPAAEVRFHATLTPNSDVALNGWTDQAGGTTNIYGAIDEASANDTDYVRSPLNPVSQVYEFHLSDATDPVCSGGHIITYRYQKASADGTVNLTVRLKQGGTTIATWNHNGISDVVAQAEQTLTNAQADAITDYTDLRVQLEAVQV